LPPQQCETAGAFQFHSRDQSGAAGQARWMKTIPLIAGRGYPPYDLSKAEAQREVRKAGC